MNTEIEDYIEFRAGIAMMRSGNSEKQGGQMLGWREIFDFIKEITRATFKIA